MKIPVLLITEKDLKSRTLIETNVDASKLNIFVNNVQETQLKPILGKVVYDNLIAEFIAERNDSVPMSEVLSTLLEDYVKPFMAYASMIDVIQFNGARISNKGLMKPTDNAAQSASTTEVQGVMTYYRNYLATYKQDLINYLKENNLAVCGTDTNTTSLGIGWYLD